jgi:hypothetical protein
MGPRRNHRLDYERSCVNTEFLGFTYVPEATYFGVVLILICFWDLRPNRLRWQVMPCDLNETPFYRRTRNCISDMILQKTLSRTILSLQSYSRYFPKNQKIEGRGQSRELENL